MIVSIVLVTYYRRYNWGKAEYIFSFKFKDSAGSFSAAFGGGGDHVHGEYKRNYNSYQGCKLAYISGTVRHDVLESFSPYFECPVSKTAASLPPTTTPITLAPPTSTSTPMPSTEIVNLEKDWSSGGGDWGTSLSDEALFLQHGPVTGIRISFSTRINSIQAR